MKRRWRSSALKVHVYLQATKSAPDVMRFGGSAETVSVFKRNRLVSVMCRANGASHTSLGQRPRNPWNCERGLKARLSGSRDEPGFQPYDRLNERPSGVARGWYETGPLALRPSTGKILFLL